MTMLQSFDQLTCDMILKYSKLTLWYSSDFGVRDFFSIFSYTPTEASGTMALHGGIRTISPAFWNEPPN